MASFVPSSYHVFFKSFVQKIRAVPQRAVWLVHLSLSVFGPQRQVGSGPGKVTTLSRWHSGAVPSRGLCLALDLGSLPRLVMELASVTAPVWECAPHPCPQGHEGLLEGKGGGGQAGCPHAPGLLCTNERQVGQPIELGRA